MRITCVNIDLLSKGKQVKVSKWFHVLELTQTNIWRINLVCGHSFYLVLEKHQTPRYSMSCWKCDEDGLPPIGAPYPELPLERLKWNA